MIDKFTKILLWIVLICLGLFLFTAYIVPFVGTVLTVIFGIISFIFSVLVSMLSFALFILLGLLCLFAFVALLMFLIGNSAVEGAQESGLITSIKKSASSFLDFFKKKKEPMD